MIILLKRQSAYALTGDGAQKNLTLFQTEHSYLSGIFLVCSDKGKRFFVGGLVLQHHSLVVIVRCVGILDFPRINGARNSHRLSQSPIPKTNQKYSSPENVIWVNCQSKLEMNRFCLKHSYTFKIAQLALNTSGVYIVFGKKIQIHHCFLKPKPYLRFITCEYEFCFRPLIATFH